MIWTDEQTQAIDARGCNLLVSAAAGSGKTAVLVERIIGLLVRDGVDIDRLLVVTFTQAAAAEMRARISRALMEVLTEDSSSEERMRRQLNLLGRASISTIHAFCTDVVRSNFHVIDIDPHFRIADAAESDLLKQETIDEFMEMEYEKGHPAFLGLVDRFGSSRSDKGLQDILLQTHSFIQSQPQPLEWLLEKVKAFATSEEDFFESNILMITMKRQICLQLETARDRFNEALAIAMSPGGPVTYLEALQNDLIIVQELLFHADSDIKTFYTQLEELNHLSLNRVNRDADREMAKKAKDLRDEGKALLHEIKTGFLFKSPETMYQEMKSIYPYLEYLYQMTEDYSRLFQIKKAEKSLLDFNDLEHFALEVLKHAELREEYQRRFSYVFVDEYQDSNLVQESIINAIKRTDNLFLVGDVKQSIYRFRLADPTLFLSKQASYGTEESALDRRIDLKTNYRSQEEIINGVNYLFRNIMSPDLGEIHYDEFAELKPGLGRHESEESYLELCLIEKNMETISDDLDEAPLDHIQIEAGWIANRIEQLLGQEMWDTKQQCNRLTEYRDIVILLRATRRWAPIFSETLTARGIPVFADSGIGYFASVEVGVFLNLLRLIDNHCQDIPLLSVMRSPLAGFSLDDMIAIRIEDRDMAFHQAVELYAGKHQDELASKLQDFIKTLHRWKEESRWLPIDEFIWRLLIETGYYHYSGAMPGGEQRQANLRILVERARQFEDSTMRGLYQFLRFVERLQSGNGDMGMAKILGENDNVVRIMSIHKSKGLEFPIVILAGLGQQFNLGDTNDPMLFHRDLGLGPRYVNPQSRTIIDTMARAVLRRKIRLESLSEEMRILYVAMTRAQARLIIYGTCANLPRCCAKWCQTPGPFTLARGRNYLDWIGPIILRHPDGYVLRDYSGNDPQNIDLLQDSSRWTVRVLDQQVNMNQESKNLLRHDQIRQIMAGDLATSSSAEADLIFSRLNWQYPYMEAESIPSKMTVSQITSLQVKDIYDSDWAMPTLNKRPAFLDSTQRIKPAEIGSLLHLVMQHIDLGISADKEKIEEQITWMAEREMIKPEQVSLVDIEKIRTFLMSPLGQRVAGSIRFFRERPFNLLCRAGDVMAEGIAGDEHLIVQGVIDLYFEENDGIVLVDYKSSYVSAIDEEGQNSPHNLVERYRPQIKLYKQALESILGARVKESYIYLFATGEAVLID
ncbi:MAG: helicase-exonuclease AddAB subunit AddA [Syntrophomonadaceae bacterium]|nr:helicase-exonuclease AddAB subunit AddA [Syntrophomonadaceae bacterium]